MGSNTLATQKNTLFAFTMLIFSFCFMSSDAVAAEQVSSAQSNPVGLKQLPIETVHESEQAKRHDEQYVVLISLDGFRHDILNCTMLST